MSESTESTETFNRFSTLVPSTSENDDDKSESADSNEQDNSETEKPNE